MKLRLIFLTISLVLLIPTIYFGLVMYSEYNQLTEKLQGDKILLVVHNNDIVAGITVDSSNEVSLLYEEALDAQEDKFIIYVNSSVIEPPVFIVEGSSYELGEKAFASLLESQTLEEAVALIVEDFELPTPYKEYMIDNFEDIFEFKSFVTFTSPVFENLDAIFIDEYINGNIWFSQDYLILKFIKYVPLNTGEEV